VVTDLVVGTNQTFTTGIAGNYCVKVTNGNGCSGYDTVQLVTTAVPQVTNIQLTKSICSGESTNIPLTSDLTSTTFHWTASLTSGLVTGFSADSGLVINQTLLNSGTVPGSVTYHVIPKIGDCAGNPVNFLVTVTPGDSVKVAITSPVNSVCAGTAVAFTALPVNPGSNPVYQWKVNGVTAGANNPTYSYIPVTGDVVTCALTSSNTVCTSNNPATSNTITMVVNPNLPVSISISPSANPVCSGTLINYNATIINGGSPPQYQWKVNNLLAGSNSPNFSFTPVNGDIVKCELTSNALCATGSPSTSGSITMAVNPVLPVNVTVSASSNPSCNGLPVTFTATPLNGGTNPIYQWKVNATNAGINSSTFTYTPSNGDLVSCTLTSSETCTTNNPASSIQYPVSVSQAPIVTFTPCFDTITTDNAKPFKLKGGLPLGGTYSGPGITPVTSIFTPSAAGLGSKTLTYSYINAGQCSKTATTSIVIRHASSVICGNPITDPRDNQVYPTTQIGTQCWLASNLNFGTEIPSTQHQVDNCIPEKYRNPASSIQYPASVYQWDELMQYVDTPAAQGLCPPGWHVPTENDWNILFASYTSNAFAGYPLTHPGFSDFVALLSGVQHLNSSWDYQDFATFFWSSNADGATKAWAHAMNSYDPSVSIYSSSRGNAFSVRCLKD
jgi:uncharacterized protein (TIGR02145 family)